ncbi:MAG: hypothetical protein AAF483_09080 [Planctomycetota bacterium]
MFFLVLIALVTGNDSLRIFTWPLTFLAAFCTIVSTPPFFPPPEIWEAGEFEYELHQDFQTLAIAFGLLILFQSYLIALYWRKQLALKSLKEAASNEPDSASTANWRPSFSVRFRVRLGRYCLRSLCRFFGILQLKNQNLQSS